MRRYPYPSLSAILILLALLTKNGYAQYTFHFEDSLLTAQETGGQAPLKLKLSGRLSYPEQVKGFRGKGLRTDGYSTWLTERLPAGIHPTKSINAEFALETYPTDTAGFFAIGTNEAWVSACIDRFGELLLGTKQASGVQYYSTGQKVDRFKWLNIAIDRSGNEAALFLNGKLLKRVSVSPKLAALNDSLIIGRDWRSKNIGVFPLTAINGIIDEVALSDRSLDIKAIIQLNPKRLSQQPSLAIPASRFANDFSRPKYHLLPDANWTNETHAFLYYNGKYHVFNQKNGANLFLGQINWGHFTSTDLIQWTEHRPALTPDKGYDENGIWSGCIIKDASGKPVVFYSAGSDTGLVVCAAYPTDPNLLTWKKYEGNPVITGNPKNYIRNDFHDPMVWRSGDAWYMAVGFGLKETSPESGALLLYKSSDLKKWDYLHPLFSGNPEKDDSGVFWEMPLFWKLNGKYILLVNKVPTRGKPAVALYWTGDFVNEKFIPDDPLPKRLEVINRLLSPSLALDTKGQTTAIAIIPDETSPRETYTRGWTHLYSIPRVWTLEHGKIIQQPHAALKKLRLDSVNFTARKIDSTKNLRLSSGHQQLELDIDLLPESLNNFGLIIGKSPSGNEFTKIYFDRAKELLVVDQSKSSLKKYVPLQIRTGQYSIAADQKVNLHLFIDGSVVEGFINHQDAFTTRLFPQSAESNQVELFTEKGTLQLLKATVWKLDSSRNLTGF